MKNHKGFQRKRPPVVLCCVAAPARWPEVTQHVSATSTQRLHMIQLGSGLTAHPTAVAPVRHLGVELLGGERQTGRLLEGTPRLGLQREVRAALDRPVVFPMPCAQLLSIC